MPSKSKSQQRLFQMALAVRKGKLQRSKAGKSVLDIADGDMTDKQIEDFCVLDEHRVKRLDDFEPGKEVRTLKDLVEAMEKTIAIPDNHHIIAVFKDNRSDKIEGFICAEYGVEGDYPMMSVEDLVNEYGLR